MNVPTKLAAFGALSAAVFFAALGVGAAVGPVDTQNQPTTHTPSIDGAHDTAGGDEMVAMDHTATTLGGLETSQAGSIPSSRQRRRSRPPTPPTTDSRSKAPTASR